MHASRLSREEFLAWLGGQYRPSIKKFSSGELARTGLQDIVLVWREKPDGDLNSPIIIVSSKSIGDFFAFVGTYISTYTPFSAFFRVTTPELFQTNLATKVNSNPTLPALIGVAIAEAFVQARGKAKDASDLSLPAVLGTLSATLASAIHRGYDSERLEEIAELWSRARQLKSGDDLPLQPAKVVQAWSIIAQAMSLEPVVARDTNENVGTITSFIQTARTSSGAIAEQLYPLSARFPSLGDAALRMRGTREERVRVLSDSVALLAKADGDILLREFLAGTLISLLGNGSFNYLPFATNLTRDLPGAALWFGLSSALQKGNDALTAANCLGRRAARDAFVRWNVFDAPRDDISIEEFDIYRRSDHERFELRGAGQSLLSIELVPGVNAKIRGPSSNRSDTTNSTASARIQNTEEFRELRHLLDRARYTLDRMATGPEQPDMFDSDSRSYRRRR